MAEDAAVRPPIVDKTLVCWVQVATLKQGGGSILTLDDLQSHFDGIVFAERTPYAWMAGSDGFQRTQEDQTGSPHEDAGPDTLVQMAIIYRGTRVTLLRNGEPYAAYDITAPQAFGPESAVVFGLRHLEARDRACFAGAIEDARIYDVALEPVQIQALRPDLPSDPAPIAWWTFTGGQVVDAMGRFRALQLHNVRLGDGKLHMSGTESFMVAARDQASLPDVAAATPQAVAEIPAGRQLRARLLADPHRPGYHLVSPEGHAAPFDPNGALFWKGRYHLMAIVQTEKGHCWAHMSSHDLLHWRHHPLALEPGGVDEGIFSGGVFVDRQGTPTITYWGLGSRAGICTATSTDDMLERWTKNPANPVIPQNRFGYSVLEDGRPIAVADPSAIWEHAGRYYMLNGNLLVLRAYGLEKQQQEYQGDSLDLFVSDDLDHWQYLHRFYQSERRWTAADEDNMCPDFFPLGDRHMVLFISHNHGCQYYIGQYAADRFTPETHGRMSWNDNTFFAPESLLDGNGRRIMWAWVFDRRGAAERDASAWSGTLSLPRVLWLGDDKTLRLGPAEELRQLRGKATSIEARSLPADQDVEWQDVAGNSLELDLVLSSQGATQYGVKVCCAPDGSEETTILYDTEQQMLTVDTTRSSLGEGDRSVEAGPLSLAPGEALHLRVFVDTSIVEVFANERQAVVRRMYPSLPDSLGVRLVSRGGPADVVSGTAWDLAPTNPW